jgi:ribonuclease-3
MSDFDLPSFQNPQWLQQAMTHKSVLQEQPQVAGNNERLEFLGDAILTFLCGEFLFKQFPDQAEGELTILRASLVDKTQLARFAELLNLGRALRMSQGIEQSGGRTNPRLLSSAFEALIGAYFLDSGSDIEAIRRYVVPFFQWALRQRTVSQRSVNFKSQLQEWTLAEHGIVPQYTIIHTSGPDHAKQFTAEVSILQRPYGQGTGRSKQAAEKQAARTALMTLGLLKH